MPVFILTIVYNFMSFGRSIEVPTLLDVQKFWVKDTDRQTDRKADYSNPPLHLRGRGLIMEKKYQSVSHS